MARFNILRDGDAWLKAKLGETIAEIIIDYVKRKYPEFRLANLTIIRTDRLKHVVARMQRFIHWIRNWKGEEFVIKLFEKSLEEISKEYEMRLKSLAELLGEVLGKSVDLGKEIPSNHFRRLVSNCIALQVISSYVWQSCRDCSYLRGALIPLFIDSTVNLIISDILVYLCPYFDPESGACMYCRGIYRCDLATKLKEKLLEDRRLRDRIASEVIELVVLKEVLKLVHAYGYDFYRMIEQMISRRILKAIIEVVFCNVARHDVILQQHPLDLDFVGYSPQPHVDYLGIDSDGNIWAFEVKATTTGRVTFSESELKALKRLRELGVKCGVVKVVLHGCWDVTIELDLDLTNYLKF